MHAPSLPALFPVGLFTCNLFNKGGNTEMYERLVK